MFHCAFETDETIRASARARALFLALRSAKCQLHKSGNVAELQRQSGIAQ